MKIWIGYRREHPSICNEYFCVKEGIAAEKSLKAEDYPQF
jgi:hypothetical protein